PKIPRLVANHALLAGHQHVEEVVDHNRDLDAINRDEHTPILRQHPAHANAARTETWPGFRRLLPAVRKGAQCRSGHCSGTAARTSLVTPRTGAPSPAKRTCADTRTHTKASRDPAIAEHLLLATSRHRPDRAGLRT